MAANRMTAQSGLTHVHLFSDGKQADAEHQTGSQQQATAHQSGDEPDDHGSQTDTPGKQTRSTRGKALVMPDPIPGNSDVNTRVLDQSIEAWKLQQQLGMTQKASRKTKWTRDFSDIEVESVTLPRSVPQCVPVKPKKSMNTSDTRSSDSDTGLSEAIHIVE